MLSAKCIWGAIGAPRAFGMDGSPACKPLPARHPKGSAAKHVSRWLRSSAESESGPIAARLNGFGCQPHIFTVHAASLDDPSRFKPQVVTYRMRALAWDHLDPKLTAFDKMPPA